jgi:hypothetical protein
MADESAPSDPFEMFRRLWGPLGLPVPGLAMPTLDPQEVDKRIADLRSVEGWLSMNLNMVRLSIQGLEVQKSALAAMRAAAGAGAAGPEGQAPGTAGPGGAGQASALVWPWSLMQRAMTPAEPAKPGEGAAPADDAGKGKQGSGT